MTTKLLFLLFLLLICRSAAADSGSDSALRRNLSSDPSLLRREWKAEDSAGGVVVLAELWCVAANNAKDEDLLAALDWACGHGSDCGPIQPGGACFSNNIQFLASYAFNDYYLRHGLDQQACYFGGNAELISLDPAKTDMSFPKSCHFPSSKSVANASLGGSASGGGLGPGGDDSSGDRVVELGWTRPFSVLPLSVVVVITGAVATWLS